MRSAELLVQCLENEGVKYMFGVPGEENLDMMDALLDSEIEFVTTRHETGAAFMAGVMGRLTGKPGICLATLGPGATNMLTGVANSNMDCNPVVAIAGQGDLERLHKESHQAYDLGAMYRPVTKYTARMTDKDIVPEVVRKAAKLAETEKPGATFIELPEDIAGMEVEGEPLEYVENEYPQAQVESIDKAADLINKAERPILLVGNGATRCHSTEPLVALAEKLQAPVTETFMGKGAISWEHPLSLMTIGLSGGDYVSCAVEKSDLIVSIGFDMSEFPPSNWNPGGKIPVLHVDTQNAEVDSAYPVVASVVGDITKNLVQLTEAVKERKEPANYVQSIRDQILNEYHQYEQDNAFPVKPQKMIHDLRDVMGEDDIVLSDVGAHKMWLARMYHCYKPNTCLISNGLASMGISVPGGIASKLVYPDKKVVSVVGDGGMLMTGMELETAVRLQLPLVIFIWRDNGYGLIEWKQENQFDRPSHISFGNPDFVKMAESFGAQGFRVEKAEDLKGTLEQALKVDGPAVIDCPVDYGENTKLTERLNQLECDF